MAERDFKQNQHSHRASATTLQTQPAEANSDFQQFLSDYGIKLSPQQQSAAATVYGPTLLTAVPGSGKTTTLTARLGYMIRRCGIDPSRICALTFTKAAANDMKKRFIELFDSNGTNDGESITFATINSLASTIYHYECKKVKGASPREVADAKIIYGIVREILEPSGEDKKGLPVSKRIGSKGSSHPDQQDEKRACCERQAPTEQLVQQRPCPS